MGGEKERERETDRETETETEGEGEGKGLLNCCFPVPAEKWWGGVVVEQLGILENLCFGQQ